MKSGKPYPQNLFELVQCMRHSVAHFDVSPMHDDGECVGFRLSDTKSKDPGKFAVELKLSEVHVFVERLAQHIRSKAMKPDVEND